MKTRKSSLSLILALVMVFVMASGALAAGIPPIVAVAGDDIDASGDIVVSGDNVRGIRANNGGKIKFSGSSSASGLGAYAVLADNQSEIRLTDTNINVLGGAGAVGVVSYGGSSVYITDGKVVAQFNEADTNSRAISASSGDAYLNALCDIEVTGGTYAIGALATRSGRVSMTGNISHKDGVNGSGAHAYKNSYLELSGNIETDGNGTHGVSTEDNATLVFSGNIVTHGENSHGLFAELNSVINMNGGTISVADNETSWHMALHGDSIINLTGVVIEGDSKNLIKVQEGIQASDSGSGSVNAVDSVLVGNVLHDGTDEGTLEINLTDSVWNGSAEAVDDIGVIDINLGNSQWNVTGDTNTNGKITGDADSKVDFNGTDENITVIIDRLGGEAGISVKPGDKLIIKNPAGNVESSNPDVIEVITNDDGSVEIISKGDGEADLTYQYVDENGRIKEVTVTVVSGAGSQPAGSGSGGSSNCNTGVGAALFALFGLAFIQKRK